MKSKNELKEIGIKNCVCCYFHDIIDVRKISFSKILFGKKLYEIVDCLIIKIVIRLNIV